MLSKRFKFHALQIIYLDFSNLDNHIYVNVSSALDRKIQLASAVAA